MDVRQTVSELCLGVHLAATASVDVTSVVRWTIANETVRSIRAKLHDKETRTEIGGVEWEHRISAAMREHTTMGSIIMRFDSISFHLTVSCSDVSSYSNSMFL